MQVQDVFKMAMSKIGAIAIDETPTTGEYALCLANANIMLASWSAHSLMLRGNTLESLALTASKASYTIGVGGDFNTSKPTTIEGAYIRDSGGTDYPMDIVEQDIYDSYPDKAIGGGRPETLYYDAGLSQQTSPTLGTLYLYPMPSSGYTIYLRSDKYLTAFVNLTDDITFEPAYEEALVYNLAVRIYRDFHQDPGHNIPPEVLGLAKSSLQTIRQMNARIPTTKLDLPTSKGGYSYDALSDRW
jgi:hypothetical protein